jgi:LysM repeat protein
VPTATPRPLTFTPVVCVKAPASPSDIAYTVESGDTVFGLAQRYCVTQKAIIDANCLTNPNDIKAGEDLVIPSAACTPTATAIPSSTPTLTPACAVPTQVIRGQKSFILKGRFGPDDSLQVGTATAAGNSCRTVGPTRMLRYRAYQISNELPDSQQITVGLLSASPVAQVRTNFSIAAYQYTFDPTNVCYLWC